MKSKVQRPKSKALCRAIQADMLNGISLRVIAQRYGVSRNTVNLIWDARGADLRFPLSTLNVS